MVCVIMALATYGMAELMIPHSSLSIVEKGLTQRTKDTLHVWKDTPVKSDECSIETKLDQLVQQGIDGDHSGWEKAVRNRFDEGFDIDLVLDNYQEWMLLHGNGAAKGSTGIVDWTPDPSFVMPLSSVSAMSGTERTRIDAIAVHSSSLVRPRGDAVKYTVHFTDGVSEYARYAWAPTALLGDEDNRHAPAAVEFWPRQAPELALEVTRDHVARIERVDVRLVLRASEGDAPLASDVTVTFPRGWSDAAWEVIPAPWLASEGGTDPITLKATLTAAPTSEATFRFSALAPSNPVLPFDVITARLSQGSLAESNLIVTYPIESTDRGLPRIVVPTTPYALRPGSEAVFGVALGNGGGEIEITRVDIEIPGGYDLWAHDANGAPLFGDLWKDAEDAPVHASPARGDWTRESARHIRWKAPDSGGVVVDAGAAAFWTVGVRMTSDPDAATSVEPVHSDGPRIRLGFTNDHVATGRSWSKTPGVPSIVIPPATRADDDPLGPTSDGYAWSAVGVASGEDRTYSASAANTATYLRGSGSYRLGADAGDAVNIESAVANATLQVSPRKLIMGSSVRVEGDLSSLLEHLQKLNIASELTVELYAPPSLGCAPTRSWSMAASAMPTPEIAHVAFGGSTLAPSLFLTSMDGNIYRIDRSALDGTGTVPWVTPLGGEPSAFAAVQIGGEPHYAVGLANGRIKIVRASDGEIVESIFLGKTPTDAIQALIPDPSRERILVLTLDDVAAVGFDGALLHRTELGGDVRGLALDAAHVYVVRLAGYSKLSHELVEEDHVEMRDILDVVPTPAFFIIATADRAHLRDPTTHAAVRVVEFPRPMERATRGDATGDGVDDLVVVGADARMFVVNGMTGATWEAEAPTAYTRRSPGAPDAPDLDELDPQNALGAPTDETDAGLGSCTESAPYQLRRTCDKDLGGGVAAILAGRGRATIATHSQGVSVVMHTREDALEWERTGASVVPTALATGSWLASTHAVAVGDTYGNIVVYDDANDMVLASSPSTRIGRFTTNLATDPGGFFGTHIVVAKLAWEQGGHEQEARVFDWFEVVGLDGKPVVQPMYRVALVTSLRDDPLASRK